MFVVAKALPLGLLVGAVLLSGARPPAGDVADLVARSRAGEQAAYAALYKRFSGAVHAAVLSYVSYGEAADVVQEVFLTGWSKLDDLREPNAFGGWILNIARSRAIDLRRSARRRPELVQDDPDAPPGSQATQLPAPRAEAREAVHAIQALPEAYRETLLMRLVEGMTGPEIAEATRMTPESVRVNLCRGMKLLRERLEGSTP